MGDGGLDCHEILRSGTWHGPAGRIALGYEARFLRRKRLIAEDGTGFLVDLPETVSLAAGDAFRLSDGALVEVVAAPEVLLEVTGPDLSRLAWHIGNRHTPCQIGPDRLLIAEDHVLADMLGKLGATVRQVTAPFTPEGGAYGHGRTMGHDHAPPDVQVHSHSHSHSHGHSHSHAHSQGHAQSHTAGHAAPGHRSDCE